MKVFILGDDLAGDGPVWLNILWPLVNVFSESFETVYLPTPNRASRFKGAVRRRVDEWREFRSHRGALIDRVETALTSDEPNILIVLAAGGRNLAWSRALDRVWDRFSHRVLHICDTLETRCAPPAMLGRFDLVTCLCQDLATDFAAKTDVPVLFWPAHCDTLNFHSVRQDRPIDLIVVGRRNEALHGPLHRHFNDPGQDRLYLDFVTRTQGPTSCEREFRLLMSTYARSAASFCYDPRHVARFRGNSPLLARWVHAWTAGCTVFGQRPTGAGTSELMDWPEATIELPDDPAAAIAIVEAVLSDRDAMAERRLRNVSQAMRRHDSRHRIELLIRKLGLTPPEPLLRRIADVTALADQLDQAGARREPTSSRAIG